MNEIKNKGILLVIGIMAAVAIAGFVLVSFLNEDYQAYLAEKPAVQSQQIQNPDLPQSPSYVGAQEVQKNARKTESTIDACVDFDNGKAYYVKGITTIESIHESRQDYCADKTTLTEFYCNKENSISQEAYFCSNGCSDGACLSLCTDSDGGNNYYIDGKAYSDDGVNFGDVCSFEENPNGILLESVCEGGSAWRVQVVCPAETPYCSGGVCSKNIPTCEDSDGGLNYQLRGSVNYGGGAVFYVELCKSNIVLLEQYCENGYPKSKEYTCPNGCKDGICINPAQNGKCTDSDGGQDYGVKGTAYGINGKNSDYCFEGNTKTLVELYCDEQGKVQNIYHDCPNGCSNGVCLTSPAEIKCSDSDGDNLFVKGQMTTNHPNWIAGDKIDYCAVSRDNGLSGAGVQQCAGAECYIQEFYCASEQQPSARFVPCSTGCQDGACIGGEKG